MKKNANLFVLSVCFLTLNACSKTNEAYSDDSIGQEASDVATTFTVQDAKNNLTYAKDQYLKMITHLENKAYLDIKPACAENADMICVPRSQEGDAIHMEQSEKWTNGFFPGVLWKLLSSKALINEWQPGEEEKLLETAKYYQNTLFSEALRGSTHDLGFILYDSFGEALHYDNLDAVTEKAYENALKQGRITLATRYYDDVGLIKSWDWNPRMKISIMENGEKKTELYTLSNPWTYPVIVDNMMNLEFLLSDSNENFQTIAFNHAEKTSQNHYFYDESDTEKQYPLSYHVFDYGSNKPGNWQGTGNISAWARGQAWSFYGFVTVVEAMNQSVVPMDSYPNFKVHLNRLFNTASHWLKDNPVPYWDLFANRKNAYEYAENTSNDTTVFSGILALCDKKIGNNIKPYMGYRPMTLPASMLSDESLSALDGKKNWHGETIIQDDKLLPCGTQPYPDSHSKIPKDTSAAAIFAAGLYRYATFTNDANEKAKFSELADIIMAELSNRYRTDKPDTGRPSSHDLGFVLSEATGDMGNGREIDTPIIYGDFYFVEANKRKIEFEQSKS
jgi:hypothetical protein